MSGDFNSMITRHPDKLIRSLQADLTTAREENERLRNLITEAKEMVEHWGSYASDYFQTKHDLAGDIKKLEEVEDE